MVAGLAFLSKKGFNPANKSNQKSVWEARQQRELDEKKVRCDRLVLFDLVLASLQCRQFLTLHDTPRRQIEPNSFDENTMTRNWLEHGVEKQVLLLRCSSSCMFLPPALWDRVLPMTVPTAFI